MAKTRRGTSKRGGKWQGIRQADMDREIYRRAQTPRGLLAGDRGNVVLVNSTLSHLTYRHPRAYGKYEMVPPPPAAYSF
ncbi:MAG: hypothetical protein KGR26_08305 [Cyanobacteria bacterium REEB65]|nr:hypothetical protein [Cyanobacteria bacterium REEB65]